MTIKMIDLNEKLSMKVLAEKMNEIIEAQNSAPAPRDRGPKSESAMTEEHALRVISGDLKDKSHKEAAELLGLSYGQVYSARKGFTFKAVHHSIKKAAQAASK